MWKNPQILFDEMTMGDLKKMIFTFVVSITEPPKIQVLPGDKGMEKAEATLKGIYNRTLQKIKDIAKKYKLKPGQSLRNHNFEAINREFFGQCLVIAAEIERSRNYQFVTEMWTAWYYGLQVMEENIFSKRKMTTSIDFYFVLIQHAISLIHKMVGTESATLVGTKDNVPVFLPHPTVARPSDVDSITFPIDIQMAFIGKDDLSFVPKYGQFDFNAITYPDWPQVGPTRVILDLLEDAYQNMRYMPHQSGSYVKINGFPRINGMLLKVFPSNSDPNGFGLMARIDLDTGSHLMIESDISEKISQTEVMPLSGSLGGYSFFLWLACQIYHDLVTAKEVKVVSSLEPRLRKGEAVAKTVTNRYSDYTPDWTCIPRILRDVEQPVRLSIPMRQEYAPRHVRGHVRKGSMTDHHRREIIRFEAETGLRVLCKIKDGYTFVRPHVSPAITPEEWDNLPRYVKARIQDDLNSLLAIEQES